MTHKTKFVAGSVVIVACVVGAASVYIASYTNKCRFPDCYTIEPLEVEWPSYGRMADPMAIVRAKGSFMIHQTPDNSIQSDRYGGACVVFKDPLGTTCQMAYQLEKDGHPACKASPTFASVTRWAAAQKENITVPQGVASRRGGQWTYCLHDGGPAAEGVCWIKLTEEHCWKSLPAQVQLKADQYYPQTAPTPASPASYVKKLEANLYDVRDAFFGGRSPPYPLVEARVGACLNGKYPPYTSLHPDPKDSGCGVDKDFNHPGEFMELVGKVKKVALPEQ